MKISNILFLLLLLPCAANSTSFNCAKASTGVEKEICTNPLLGELDDALSDNYKFMLASDIGDGARKHLRSTQKKWISERNVCTNKKCIEETYRKRMDEICDYPVLSGTYPPCTYSDSIK